MNLKKSTQPVIFPRPVVYSSKGSSSNPVSKEIVFQNKKLSKYRYDEFNERLETNKFCLSDDSKKSEDPPKYIQSSMVNPNKSKNQEVIEQKKCLEFNMDKSENYSGKGSELREISKSNLKEDLDKCRMDEPHTNLNQGKKQNGESSKPLNKQMFLIPKEQTDTVIENPSATIINMNEDGIKKKIPKDCVALARKAFGTGRTKSLDFRKKQLKGLLKFLECHKADIEEALYKDLQKHKQEANMCEIELVANDLRHTLIEFNSWAKPQKVEKRLINILDGVYVQSDPYGVVLIIGAWNYPILLTLGPLVGALAGGNTIILKPSELAPTTNKLLSEVLVNYLDAECFQVLLGGVVETTELLKEKFDYIFFTGSTRVGQIVHKAAAKNLTPTTLELGGKCPLYLDSTVNIARATKRIIWGRFLNSGQTCVAPDYLMCTKDVQEKFIDEAKRVLQKFYGDDPKKSKFLSRIVNETHFKRLINFIRPENVAVGGDFNQEHLIISPTILTNVNPHDAVMEEEIFGPILPILIIKDVKESIDFINSRGKPLALYVFSNNKTIQNMFLKSTSSGGISINDTVSHIGTEGLPFGGIGSSGMGTYHGKMGFDTFTQKRAVLIKDLRPISEFALGLRYPPYSENKTKLVNFILKKRKSLSWEFIQSVIIFLGGVLVVFLVQYILKVVKDDKYELE